MPWCGSSKDVVSTTSSAKVKVYGMAFSTCTRRVLIALEEKGVAYELVTVDLMKNEQKGDAFLAKQPFGVIPLLEHGDVTVLESRAIARYIANTWAGQGFDLLGKDAAAKASTDMWLEAENSHYNGPVSAIVFEKMFKVMRGGVTDDEVVAAEVVKLNKVLDVYEGILSKQEYLAGPNFSLADLSHLPYTQYMVKVGVMEPFDSHPACKAWWERISTRLAWQKVNAM